MSRLQPFRSALSLPFSSERPLYSPPPAFLDSISSARYIITPNRRLLGTNRCRWLPSILPRHLFDVSAPEANSTLKKGTPALHSTFHSAWQHRSSLTLSDSSPLDLPRDFLRDSSVLSIPSPDWLETLEGAHHTLTPDWSPSSPRFLGRPSAGEDKHQFLDPATLDLLTCIVSRAFGTTAPLHHRRTLQRRSHREVGNLS